MVEPAQPFRPERLRRLTEMIQTHGRLTVAEAAAELRTSTETIRKDLVTLEGQGVLRRVHGGALHVESMTHEPEVATRGANVEEKRRIAEAALAHLPQAGAIFIDAGSTTEELVRLFPNRRLTVFTNTLTVASALAALSEVRVHTLGGRVRAETLAEVGSQALATISTLSFDLAYVGTNAISVERGLSTPDVEEASVKAAMIRNAERSCLLADHTKFARTSLVRYAGVEELDLIVTGRELDAQHRSALKGLDVEVSYA